MPGVGQVGIYTPLDTTVFLRHDGTIPLSAPWNSPMYVIFDYLRCASGGNITLGEQAANLRIVRNAAEIIEILGVSNNQANLHLKNLRVGDLAGVGNRNVIADVNGDLSAP